MGGQALGHFVRRHPAVEYEQKARAIHFILCREFTGCKIQIVQAYAAKESFGDLDVVVASDNLPHDWVQRVLQAFNSVHHQKNGNVLSAEYVGLQVDIITHPYQDFDFAVSYYAFNDLGNLMGRTAFGMGLKLAHNGLYYRHQHGYKNSDVLITKDWDTALTLLGFNAERWRKGFTDLEQIFDFVRCGEYYTTRDFLLENRNHKAKTRDSKRQSYMKFLDYVRDCGDVEGVWASLNWTDWKYRLFKDIPELRRVVAELEVSYQILIDIKKVFNGGMVTELTGLKGKDLGEFMAHAKAEPDFVVRACNDDELAFRQWVWELYRAWSYVEGEDGL